MKSVKSFRIIIQMHRGIAKQKTVELERKTYFFIILYFHVNLITVKLHLPTTNIEGCKGVVIILL